MSTNSTIEWTESTWNPVRGCRRVSPGCEHCYAERLAHRFSGPGGAYEGLTRLGKNGPLWTGKVQLVASSLGEPLRWRRPRLVFVNSMSDLFHEDVPLAYIKQVFDVMRQAERHTFQILTKRSRRLLELSPSLDWPPNVWMGVSVESEAYLHRVDALRDVPAAVRFLSLEPLLEALPSLDVIVGGESGPGARPLMSGWVRDIRGKCASEGVPFFFKQWGGVRKKEAGRLLDGEVYDAMPVPVPPVRQSELF